MLYQKLNNSAYFFVGITFLWLFFQNLYGFKLIEYREHEACKYFNAALYFINNGYLPNIRYLFYGVITGLIALHLKYQFSVFYLIGFQLGLNFIAILCFGYVIKKKYSSLASFVSVFLLVASYDWTIWNYRLYSESLFFSFTLLWISSLISFSKLTPTKYLIQMLLLIGCIFSRPIGVGYLLIYGVLLYQNSQKIDILYRKAIFAFILLFFLTISYVIISKMEDHSIYLSTIEGCVVCGVPTEMRLHIINPQKYHPIMLWLELIWSYPFYFLKLFFLRILFLFSPYLTYFSFMHNFQNIILSLAIYSGLVARFYREKRWTPLEKSILFFLLVFIVIVGLQCNDWSRRFFAAILPFLILLGVSRVFSNVPKNNL